MSANDNNDCKHPAPTTPLLTTDDGDHVSSNVPPEQQQQQQPIPPPLPPPSTTTSIPLQVISDQTVPELIVSCDSSKQDDSERTTQRQLTTGRTSHPSSPSKGGSPVKQTHFLVPAVDKRTLEPSSSAESLDSEGEPPKHRPPTGLLRRVYNRIRIAAFISNAKRSERGRETEPDSNALLGDIHMKEVVRVSPSAQGTTSGTPVSSAMAQPMGRERSQSFLRHLSISSQRSIPNVHLSHLPRSPTTHSHLQHLQHIGGIGLPPSLLHIPTAVGGGSGGGGGGDPAPPTSTPSTTRNYLLAQGNIHFWRNNAFESEGHPFLRVTHDINVDDVASIMHGRWKMKPPRIVTLVISNVSALKGWGNVRQRLNFQKGLLKAARTTNMWIFTNGANIGAAKVIGDAIYTEKREKVNFHCHLSHIEQNYYYNPLPNDSYEPPLHVIGVIREELVRNAENFGDGEVNVENLGNSLEEGKYDLNPDHTHYIIIRDHTVNKTGINLFASRIMQYLSTIGGVCEPEGTGITSPSTHDVPDLCSLGNMEIPVVSIVIQGGYDCARLILDCLKRKYPVVVLRGSGGLADLLSYAYLELKQRCRDSLPSAWGNWDPEFVESYLKPELSQKIAHHFPKMRENALSRNMFRDRILECVRLAKQNNLTFMTILNMHNYSECRLENLSVYLLRALFKSKPRTSTGFVHGTLDISRNTSDLEGVPISDERLLKELYLTLDWNCPDVARDEVLVRDPSYCSRLQKELFLSALLRSDREEFIDLFISYGFRIHTFVTPKRLLRLFKHIYHQEFFRTVCWEGVLGHSLLSKPSKYFVDTDLNWLIETVTGLDNFVNSDHLYFNVISMYVHNQASAERKALAILCLWAVFGNRSKLVKTLWKHSDQPIHLALIISMAYERLSWHVGDSSLKNDLKEQSKLFADMAIGVLDSCYSAATCRAFDVLSEEGPDWNYKTAVDIAANARTRSFLAHPCCQKWLTNTFLGEIRIRELSWGFFTVPAFVKILLCAFFVFPMFVWVRFRPKIVSPKVDPEAEEDDIEHLVNEEAQALIDPPQDSQDSSQLKLTVPILSNSNGGKGVLRNRRTLLWSKSTSDREKNEVGDGNRSEGTGTGTPGGGTPADDSKFRRQSMRPDLYTSLLKDREVIIRSQPPLHKMIYYMWSAPITKFWTFHTFYIIYLLVFSLAVLWPSCGNPYLDAIVCSWTVLIIIENIHRTWILYRKYTSVPLVFKCLEVLLLITFVVVYAATSIWNVTLFQPYTRKVILCFALIYFYYRLIAIYLPISPTLGPLLYRLKLMVTVDFMNFMRMALVLIISSGIVMQSVMYPDNSLDWTTFQQAFHRAWFTLFTTPTDDLFASPACTENLVESDDTCYAGNYIPSIIYRNTSIIKCPTTGFFPYFFAIQYFVLLKLIMITLLYALFSSTASQLEVDSIWKYQRYILVVDFASRLPVPSPLSVFCYAYYMIKWIVKLLSCRYKCFSLLRRTADQLDAFDKGGGGGADTKYNMKLSEEDFNFWRHLAREYARKQKQQEEEADMAKKQFETVQTIYEEIEYEKKLLRQFKGNVKEVERMLLTSHVYLENIKHLSSFNRPSGEGGAGGLPSSTSKPLSTIIMVVGSKTTPHILSRQSPYSSTSVQRIPVPDKFVPWEVSWIDYDPVAYSKPKYDFHPTIQPFVDEDIVLLQELQMDEVRSKIPVFKWNTSSVNPAGITIDRTSWCAGADGQNLIYKLDQGLPRNPFGRTGLKGRGSLPRFGPNHYVMLVITRWRTTHSSLTSSGTFSDSSSKILEFVALRVNPLRWDQYAIPCHFIPEERVYTRFHSMFKIDGGDAPWISEEAIGNFLRSCLVDPESDGISQELHVSGYLDDPENTDNAWKEVELFHFHFSSPDSLIERLDQSQVAWRIISEDVFVKLPVGQSALLHDLIKKLQPTIL